MSKRVSSLLAVGVMVGAVGCDYPSNPLACANDPGLCPTHQQCVDDGQRSYCADRDMGGGDFGADRGDGGPSGDGPRAEVAEGPIGDADPDGPCTNPCEVGDRICQGSGVAECKVIAGCAKYQLEQMCTPAQTCQAMGKTASCACANPCALGDLRCSEGLQQCVSQEGCPVWQAVADGWLTQTLPREGGVRFGQASLAVTDGLAHVLVQGVVMPNQMPMHAQRSAGGVWTVTNADPPAEDIVTELRIRSGASGVVQGVFARLGAAVRLRVGSKAPSGMWSVEDLAPAATPQRNIVNVDLSVRGDTAAIAYDGEGSVDEGFVSWLRVKSAATGSWSVTPIVNASERSSIYPAAAIDAAGRVVVSYFSTRFKTLTFNNLTQNETLENDADPGNIGYVSRIAFDSNGGLHVIAGGPSVRHFYRPPNQTTWQKGMVATGRASELRLEADGDGGMHAILSDNSVLRYARKAASGEWTVTQIPHWLLGSVRWPDLAVNGQRVHVIYSRDSGDAHYATSCR